MQHGPAERVVLIVDDDPLVRRFLGRIVATVPGITSLLAPTAEEGLRLVNTHRVDLVITDMNMPGQDGLWLLQQLRSGGYNVPLILHSGSLDPGEEPEALRMGVARIVHKPATPADILKAISEILG